MKSLRESLLRQSRLSESLFDNDLLQKDLVLNGVSIDNTKWKLCSEYFKKRRKKYFGTMSKVTLGDMMWDFDVLYNGDDCIVAVTSDPNNRYVYVLCPETIYMCHEAAEIHGKPYLFSLTNIDEANDFDISFYWSDILCPGWGWIGGVYSGNWEKRMEEAGFESLVGYIPKTISKKAADVIKKYVE